MKKEFNNGDIAYLSNGKRMKGYTLPPESMVEIVKAKKISNLHGFYSYSANVVNPKNGKSEYFEDWFTQNDFLTKSMAQKMISQLELLMILKEKLEVKNNDES